MTNALADLIAGAGGGLVASASGIALAKAVIAHRARTLVRLPSRALLALLPLGLVIGALISTTALSGPQAIATYTYLALGVAVTITDLDDHWVPRDLTRLATVAIAALVTGWAWVIDDLRIALLALIGAALAWIFGKTLTLLGGMGGGDTAWMIPSAFLLGATGGLRALTTATIAALVIAAATALVLLASRRATLRSDLPFIPALVAGTLIGALA